jgi:ABC-type glycerol-3-phosphate transport system substrate-binding protein
LAIVLMAIIAILLIVFFVSKAGFSGREKLVGKRGEIVWWGIQMDEEEVLPFIEAYQNDNSNIKITYVKQSAQNYRERLSNALASGKGPDIFEIHNSWPVMLQNDLSSLPASVIDAQEYSQTFYSVAVSDMTLTDRIVGIPFEYDAITLFVNEDILLSSGRKAPKTWDELRRLAIELTQHGNEGIVIQSGVALGITQNIDYWPEILALMLLQNGVSLDNPIGQLAVDAIEYYLLFAGDGVWDPRLPPSTIAFARGKLAMYFAPSKQASVIIQTNPDLMFRTVPLPQLPKELPSDPDMSYATYWAQGVWARSVNQKESWKFLKHLSSKEVLSELNQKMMTTRGIGRIPSRTDLASTFARDPVLGSVISLAGNSRSWYLADKTHDGNTGVNTQINGIYRGIIDIGKVGAGSLEGLTPAITRVLSQYSANPR